MARPARPLRHCDEPLGGVYGSSAAPPQTWISCIQWWPCGSKPADGLRLARIQSSPTPYRLPRPAVLLRRAVEIGAVVLIVAVLVNQAFAHGPAFFRIVRDSYRNQTEVLGGSDFTAFFGGTRLLLHSPSRAYNPHA